MVGIKVMVGVIEEISSGVPVNVLDVITGFLDKPLFPVHRFHVLDVEPQ